MKSLKAAALAAAFALASTAPYAAEIDRQYESIRALGMGGAYTAVARDEGALLYNPATLSNIEAVRIAPLTVLIGAGDNARHFAEDFDGIDSDNTTEVADLLRDNLGEHLFARTELMPSVVGPGWGVALLGQARLNAEPHNLANPEMDVDAIGSASIHVGFSKEIGEVALGVTAKYITFERLDEIYEATDIADEDFDETIEDDLKHGEGFGLDFGATYSPEWALSPTFAVAVINFWEPDDSMPAHINLGLGLETEVLSTGIICALDLVDVTTQLGEDEDLYKRLHAGIELSPPGPLTFRAGINQGYSSLGATLDLWIAELDYAWYAEEVGSAAGMEADRRNVFRLSFGW